MRRKFFFEAAQAESHDQTTPLPPQGEVEHGALGMRVFARDVGDERDPRARHRLPALDPLGQRVEDLARGQAPQMQRHADEALGVAHVLTGLVDVELRDHQGQVVGRADRVDGLAVDIDEVREVAEVKVALPLFQRGQGGQVDPVPARDRVRRVGSRRALEVHVNLGLGHDCQALLGLGR